MATQVDKFLDFEREIVKLQTRIDELLGLVAAGASERTGEIHILEDERDQMLRDVYGNLDPWQIVSVARHSDRPVTMHYVSGMFEDFIELHGDRAFGDDPAIITGFAHIEGRKVLVVGHRKGRTTHERIRYNFGCAHPEGYRKAFRKMQLAENYGLPIITLINTPGAYPGIGAEERGQANAIAENIALMAGLRVPIISIVIGEGGSGGALGIGVCDRLLVQEFSYYSIISPEGCSSILWKSAAYAEEAAKALKLTSRDLFELGIADEVIKEPLGGAHRDPQKTIMATKEAVVRHLHELSRLDVDELMELRFEKYRKIGDVHVQGDISFLSHSPDNEEDGDSTSGAD
ncbi:MAG: acetyl-CoA carboxylase carboxyltransferase subunit alpha [Planctomycetes bacterium]|nr:acetyl-CoA carboxylase carboxyltransferase subunit alpha [Planctomycetota bacterium]